MNRNFKSFLVNEFVEFDNTKIVKADISKTDKQLEVFLMGNPVDEKSIEDIKVRLPEYGLEKYELSVVQTNVSGGISLDDLDDMINKNGFMDKETIEEANKNKNMLDVLTSSQELKKSVSKEILTLYPTVQNAGFADTVNRDDKDGFTLVIDVSEYIIDDDLKNMEKWLHDRFGKEVNVKQILINQ